MADGARPWWSRTLFTIALEQMSHRPPLPKRWLVYCAVAYILPVVLLEALPESAGTFREVSWLVTLAPAFILSLHYGMLGALAGLVAGTVLFIAVQVVLNVELMGINQDVLLPIYVSYGMLAIAVGWLSQQLHDYYSRLLKAERLAAIGEVAVTLRHELNNALQAIAAEAGMLGKSPTLSERDRDGLETILDMSRRINGDVQKLATLAETPPSTPYVAGRRMVDLAVARSAPDAAGA
jgi:signal transduction histidine kinase